MYVRSNGAHFLPFLKIIKYNHYFPQQRDELVEQKHQIKYSSPFGKKGLFGALWSVLKKVKKTVSPFVISIQLVWFHIYKDKKCVFLFTACYLIQDLYHVCFVRYAIFIHFALLCLYYRMEISLNSSASSMQCRYCCLQLIRQLLWKFLRWDPDRFLPDSTSRVQKI